MFGLGGLLPSGRRWLVPEVLQTSMMDCGPAALKSVLDGFGKPVNFERLRERCQTDVDGTSLSAIDEAAGRLGLETELVMVPRDNLLLPECEIAPAIVFLVNPDGSLHFVVLWSVGRTWLQVMDPARGRIWMRHRAFLDRVAAPSLPLPAPRWRQWAQGDDFQAPLAAKLRRIGVPRARVSELLARAGHDPSPAAFAALDAAARFVGTLIEKRALSSGASAQRLLEKLFESEAVASPDRRTIPPPFWICTPSPRAGTIISTGAVVLHVAGTKEDAEELVKAAVSAATDDGEPAEEHTMMMADAPPRPVTAPARRPSQLRRPVARLSTLGVAAPRLTQVPGVGRGTEASRMSMWAGPVLAPSVKDELSAPTVKPHRIFARMMWSESRASVVAIACLLVISVGTGVVDTIMMRGLASTVGSLTLPAQRIGAIVAVATFLVFAFGVDVAQAAIVQRLARGLEARLRVAFLEKLPLLEDRYFRSRPISDMASRAHLLQTLRNVPTFVVTLLTNVLNILVTTGMLVWLEPRLKWLAFGLLVFILALPVISYRLLDEALSRQRVHGASLSRFYLDALLGVLPIRVHGAERAVRREHEAILTEWVRTARQVETTTLGVRALEGYFSTFVSVALVVSFVARGGDLRGLLLLALFAQRLPAFAQALVATVRNYPLMKHDAMRLFEPLAAAETGVAPVKPAKRALPARGVNLAFRNVSAAAGGRDVLRGVSLEVRAGTHVAIVGASGAGKSSLVSILLGWLFVSEGAVLIDGRPLDPTRIAQLRDETAWVDPSIQLWNRSLFENLIYGHGEDAFAEVESALESADLLDVVERLPSGLQSSLGEGGARVSGGQGQRVRLGRAMLKRDARLVILDEPFRGLERDKRRVLLARARALWPTATILYVTHDVGDTLEMDRVVVVNEGGVAEVGAPAELLARRGAYHALVEADRAARSVVWGRPEWRRIAFEGDKLHEAGEAAE